MRYTIQSHSGHREHLLARNARAGQDPENEATTVRANCPWCAEDLDADLALRSFILVYSSI